MKPKRAAFYLEIGARVRRARLRRKISQIELERVLGLKKGTLGMFERLGIGVTLEKIEAMCEILRVETRALLEPMLREAGEVGGMDDDEDDDVRVLVSRSRTATSKRSP